MIRRKTTMAAAVVAMLVAAFGWQGARAQGKAAQPSRQAAKEKPRIDPRADRVLKQMSDYMARLSTFGYKADHITEVVTEDGQKLQYGATSTLSLKRPDHIRADRTGEKGDVSFYYDGKNVTIYGRRANLYATQSAPGTIDETIDAVASRLGLVLPAGDLLFSKPYEELTSNVVSGTYLGRVQLDGVETHHLAFRGQDVDWQIWVEDGPRPLPRKYVITSRDMPQAPQFTVSLREWDVSPGYPEDLFTFTPPPGAEKIDFLQQKAVAQGQPAKGEAQ